MNINLFTNQPIAKQHLDISLTCRRKTEMEYNAFDRGMSLSKDKKVLRQCRFCNNDNKERLLNFNPSLINLRIIYFLSKFLPRSKF